MSDTPGLNQTTVTLVFPKDWDGQTKSIVEIMTPYVQAQDEAIFRIQAAIAKSQLDTSQMKQLTEDKIRETVAEVFKDYKDPTEGMSPTQAEEFHKALIKCIDPNFVEELKEFSKSYDNTRNRSKS